MKPNKIKIWGGKLKSGDRILVIAGKDSGKKAKILQVFPKANKATIEGVNLAIKHMKPRKQNEKGQKIQFPAPMNISNIMLICPKCNHKTRIGYKMLEGRKVRICRKCKELID